MFFHSPGFILIFLPLFLMAMYSSPKGAVRAGVLLVCSYLFYSGGEPLFIWLLLISSVTDYMVALRIDRTANQGKRRTWLAISLILNLGLLSFFKYGGWVLTGLAPYFIVMGITVPSPDFFRSFALPAGISFYTFQSLAYTIDVYRGQVKPERSLLAFCNYVAYLPQLIAGPIERFSHLAPQLYTLTHGNPIPQWTAGLDRIFLGITQKLLLADGCGQLVDRLVANAGPWDLLTSWAVGIGFGLQIYFDFAAYSHMAIGIALLLGVRLQENFLAPYQAASIQEFWHRWHITLSRWFRDYLYIPLGGSRRGHIHTIFNLLVTFLLCGLWHGAGWNFLLWGFLHGFYLILFRVKAALLPNWCLPHPVAVILTFAMVCYAWVPFRIDDTIQIVQIWRGMSGLNGLGGAGVSNADLLILTLLTVGTLTIPHAGQRWPGYSGWVESATLAGIALFALFSAPSLTTFIYFQF